MRYLLAILSLVLLSLAVITAVRWNAQVTPYLVIPKPASEIHRSTTSPSRSSVRRRAALSVRSSSPISALQKFRQEVLDLVNVERKKRGLSLLTRNPLLEKSAQAHADDMVKRNYFSHTSPDGSTPEDRIRATGYLAKPCTNCSVSFSYGENIAKGQRDAKEAMADWMSSKIHRDNILQRDFKEFGLGYAGDVWVQNFGGITVK